MKTSLPFVLLSILTQSIYVVAQTVNPSVENVKFESLEFISPSTPCISAFEYQLIEARCNTNAAHYLQKSSTVQSTAATLLSWPLKAAPSFHDCSFYFIAAYVDQDNTTAFKDYNCGSNTYDGHKGTDIAIAPFPFYKMDNDQVQVVAAAAGTIIDKHDGEYDRNCVGSGSTLTANYVIIQHTDGSRALYWHMKKNSIIPKAIGQTVVTGEQLGVVGSSGSSSGPHLHFEVWSGSTQSTLVDPYSGSCNSLNASSWWTAQKPYTEPAVIKASVHTTDIVTPPCGTTETTNESTSFTIPFQGAGLTPGYAKFYVFVRNVTANETVSMKILNPNSSLFTSWNYTIPSTNKLIYAGFSKKLPTTAGTYSFVATYNGIDCAQAFDIVVASGINDLNSTQLKLSITPNPVTTFSNIEWARSITDGQLRVFNTLGEKIEMIDGISGDHLIMSKANLDNGIYFIQLVEKANTIGSAKLVIAD